MAGIGDRRGILVPGEQQIRAARFDHQRQARGLRLHGGGLMRARQVAGIDEQRNQYGHGSGYAAEHQHEFSAALRFGWRLTAQRPNSGFSRAGLEAGRARPV